MRDNSIPLPQARGYHNRGQLYLVRAAADTFLGSAGQCGTSSGSAQSGTRCCCGSGSRWSLLSSSSMISFYSSSSGTCVRKVGVPSTVVTQGLVKPPFSNSCALILRMGVAPPDPVDLEPVDRDLQWRRVWRCLNVTFP